MKNLIWSLIYKLGLNDTVSADFDEDDLFTGYFDPFYSECMSILSAIGFKWLMNGDIPEVPRDSQR